MVVRFRAVSEGDRPEVDAWIAADPGHAGNTTADFFLMPGQFHSLYAVEDEQGTTMYLRCEREGEDMRAHIQFGPDLKRVLVSFREGFPMVAADAKKRNFKSIVFSSCSPTLAKWMILEFKFRAELEFAL